MCSQLPPEILDHIHQFLAADDSLSLCYVSKTIFMKTLAGKKMFKNIFSRCWLGNESFEEAKFVMSEIKKNWIEDNYSKDIDNQILFALKAQCEHEKQKILNNVKESKYVVGRICLDLSMIHRNLRIEDLLREINGVTSGESDDDDAPKVLLQKQQHNQDVTYFIPGDITSLTSAASSSCSSKGPLKLEDISNSIITYAISKSHIALVLSVNFPQGIRVSIWRLSSSAIQHLYLTSSDHLLSNHRATINEEDILAHGRFLFTLPVCNIKRSLLQVFDMDTRGLPLVASFDLESGLRRMKPLIEKEGSATRLHIYQDRLVVIVPLPHWTIYILDISPFMSTTYTHHPMAGVINLNCVFRKKLSIIEPAKQQPFTFYASDQTDSILLLGFVEKWKAKNNSESCSQCFITFDLKKFHSSGSDGKVFIFKEHDWGMHAEHIPRIPYLTENEGVINTGVAHECFLATSSTLNKFAILTHRGTILMMDKSLKCNVEIQVSRVDLMEKCKEMIGVPGELIPQDTFYDQLELIGQDNLLALKVISPHKLLFCISFSGSILWSADLSSQQFNMNPSHRVFITSMDPVVIITDPSNSSVLSAESGELVSKLKFPPVVRKTEEPPRDSYYGYAACAYGSWEVVRTANRIVHVHDIERSHPVVMDVFFCKL